MSTGASDTAGSRAGSGSPGLCAGGAAVVGAAAAAAVAVLAAGGPVGPGPSTVCAASGGVELIAMSSRCALDAIAGGSGSAGAGSEGTDDVDDGGACRAGRADGGGGAATGAPT